MATILKFRPAGDDGRRRVGDATDRGCEIVLFPGVRYERWAEPQVARPSPGKTVRDILTLVD